MPLRSSVFAALLLAACSGGGAARDAEDTDPGPLFVGQEDVVTVAAGPIATGPRISGTLTPARQATLTAETAGSVTWVGAEVGHVVAPGNPLVRIEDPGATASAGAAAAAIRAAEADLALAVRNARRQWILVEAGAAARVTAEQADAAVVAAQARVEQARAQLTTAGEQVEASAVTSPIGGVVSVRSVSPGDVVAPGSPLYTVVDPTSLRLEASVPAEAIGSLAVGAPVTFEVQGYPGRAFEGFVESVAPAVDPGSRQIAVLVTVPNPGGALVAGLFAEGRVATQQREGLVVPMDAVETVGGAATVRRITRGVVEQVPVKVGLTDEDADRVEITEGIQAGDVLLVGGALLLDPGTRVEVRSEAPMIGG